MNCQLRDYLESRKFIVSKIEREADTIAKQELEGNDSGEDMARLVADHIN